MDRYDRYSFKECVCVNKQRGGRTQGRVFHLARLGIFAMYHLAVPGGGSEPIARSLFYNTDTKSAFDGELPRTGETHHPGTNDTSVHVDILSEGRGECPRHCIPARGGPARCGNLACTSISEYVSVAPGITARGGARGRGGGKGSEVM